MKNLKLFCLVHCIAFFTSFFIATLGYTDDSPSGFPSSIHLKHTSDGCVEINAQKGQIIYFKPGDIFDNYKRTIKFDQAFQEEGRKKQAERDRIVQEIRSLQNIDPFSAKIKKKENELIEFDELTRGALGQAREAAAKTIFQDMDNVIGAYMAENGLSKACPNDGNSSPDVTKEILNRLNKKYESLAD
ncbi:MAG: hypothetical protein A2987_05600 [Omnitrophica bacterium RIFCSPLOWO2_01_FULL_45_10]|nr:MAG: hypothetical protein A2987_05600 [Omnitrophica bacterium RIFCSPLOWO2_01_FULL_45_10]